MPHKAISPKFHIDLGRGGYQNEGVLFSSATSSFLTGGIMAIHRQSVFLFPLLFGFSALLLGQGSPSNIHVSVVNDSIELTWDGEANFYEVQSSASLEPLNWLPVVKTSEHAASIPWEQERVFLRVGTIDSLPPAIEMTDQRELEIMDEIYNKILTMEGTNEQANREALLAFLSGYDEIVAAGWARDEVSLYAAFANGQTLLIVDNQPYDYPGKPGVETSDASGNSLSTRKSAASLEPLPELQHYRVSPEVKTVNKALSVSDAQGLPLNNKAVLVKAEESSIQDNIVGALSEAFVNRHYDTDLRPASVERYLSLDSEQGEMGVLIVDSHGGLFPVLRSIQRTETKVLFNWREEYVVKTTTPITVENLASYKAMIDSNELVKVVFGPETSKGIMFTPTEKNPVPPVEVPEGTYAITSRFVRQHFRFAKNSFVYFDTCWSAHRDAREFREACFDKGASVYAGWDRSIHYEAAEILNRDLFDGLLGLSQLVDTQPRQRPFDLNAMIQYLDDTYGFRDPKITSSNPGRNVFGGKLTFFDAPTNRDNGVFKLLSPSIRNMYVNEMDQTIQVFGLFDPDADIKIQVNGNSMGEFSPDTVSKSQLTFSLPALGQPSAGWVTVIQEGRISNSVPLTQWHVPVNLERYFTAEVYSPSASYSFDLFFRGDLHPFRVKPYLDPVRAGSSLFLNASSKSSGRLASAGGTYIFPNGKDSEKWELANGPLDLALDYPRPSDNFLISSLTLKFNGVYDLSVTATARDSIKVTQMIGDETLVSNRDVAGHIFSPEQNTGTWNSGTYNLSANSSFENVPNKANWGAVSAEWAPDQAVETYAE